MHYFNKAIAAKRPFIMSNIAVKLNFNGVIRRFQFARNQNFSHLVEAAAKRYPEIHSMSVSFTYKDEEGDVIYVSTDEDLSSAFMVLDQEGWNAILFNISNDAESPKKKLESRDQPPSQKPDLQLLSSSLHESFTVVGTPVETKENKKIPVAVEVENEPNPAKSESAIAETETQRRDAAVKLSSESDVNSAVSVKIPVAVQVENDPAKSAIKRSQIAADRPPERSANNVTSVPLRATSGGALIYPDGTVEFGMGGEAVLLPDGQTISCMLSYKGFPSVAASGLVLTHGCWYYEVSLLTSGLMQIGWATPQFTGSSGNGEGVGDDKHSFAYDGFRQLKWANGEAQRWGRKWRQGDTVCCAVDIDSGVIQFALNGNWNSGLSTVAFSELDLTKGLIPALSFQKGEKCCINFGATEFSYGPPSKTFRGVNSAFNSEWNCAKDFPPTASPRKTMKAPSATEQLAAMLLKDEVRDAVSRFLGHPVVATAVQHIAVAVLQDQKSAARIAKSQISVIMPILLQLLSEQPALLGLLPKVLELLQTLLLGSESAFSVRGRCGNHQNYRVGRNWCKQKPSMEKSSWRAPCKNLRRGVKFRCSDPRSQARSQAMHAASKCPVNRAHQAISSFVKETGDQFSKWASNLRPESDSEKKFKSDLQRAIKMSMSPGQAKRPVGKVIGSEPPPSLDRKHLHGNKVPAGNDAKSAHGGEKIEYPPGGNSVEITDLDRAVALSYEEQGKTQRKNSVFKEAADDLFKHMFEEQAHADEPAPSPVQKEKSTVATNDRLRAKFIEQRTFNTETGEAVDLSNVAANTRLCHTWTMMNPAAVAWPPNVVGKVVGKNDPKIITSQFNTTVPVAAQSPVHITVEARTPSEPGRYISYFRLFDPASLQPFGDRIWLDMTVSASSSDTDWDMLHGDDKAVQ